MSLQEIALQHQLDAAGVASDYGSDLDADDEEVISTLLAQLEADGIEPLLLESIEGDQLPTVAKIPKLSNSQSTKCSPELPSRWHRAPSVEIEYDVLSRAAWSAPRENGQTKRDVAPEPAPPLPDTRSPLERFRTAPKKPLSVTDIVSPAWCELQYWYTLTKHGKKKRTPAMRQGSRVHKVLEDQVHVFVPVDVQTREDRWGLRIWNVIQGLRTLRSTGMTRELEIWGVIDGQVVNGIIDELSYTCPDEELERRVMAAKEKESKTQAPPADQQRITKFLSPSGAKGLEDGGEDFSEAVGVSGKRVYLIDIKTRGTKSLPQAASMRSTHVQLMLYKHILSDLLKDRVNASTIFDRYRLDASAHFSDSFIAQFGSLDFSFTQTPGEEDHAPFPSSQDSLTDLLDHNSLAQLWQLMIREFQRAIPTTTTTTSISDVLKAEYRSQTDASLLGSRTFLHDEPRAAGYLADGMKWWRGERPARGVDVEEAYKCRVCEFADECTWRMEKVDEVVRKSRLRAEPRRTSAV